MAVSDTDGLRNKITWPRSYGSTGLPEFHWSGLLRCQDMWPAQKILTTLIDTAKFPEQLFPRKYDIVCASHQTLPNMVMLSALAYTEGLRMAFRYNHSEDAAFTERNPNGHLFFG